MTAQTVNNINIEWGASADLGYGNLLGYQIFRNGTSHVANNGNGTSYSDTTVSPGLFYSYTVGSITEGGTGTQTSALTGQAGYVPTAPTNPSVTESTTLNIKTEWDLPADMGTGTLQGYQIKRDNVVVVLSLIHI